MNPAQQRPTRRGVTEAAAIRRLTREHLQALFDRAGGERKALSLAIGALYCMGPDNQRAAIWAHRVLHRFVRHDLRHIGFTSLSLVTLLEALWEYLEAHGLEWCDGEWVARDEFERRRAAASTPQQPAKASGGTVPPSGPVVREGAP